MKLPIRQPVGHDAGRSPGLELDPTLDALLVSRGSAASCAVRLSVVLSTKRELERETGLEPATFSLEGLGVLAQ